MVAPEKSTVERLVSALADEFADRIAQQVLSRLNQLGGPAPVLLDRAGLCRFLRISPGALDRLRRRPGFPELRVGEAPRFEPQAVLTWLKHPQEFGRLREVATQGK